MDEISRSRVFIASPEYWPARPRLPLRRRWGFDFADWSMNDFGYLVEGCGLSVFVGNMLLPPTGQIETYTNPDILLSYWRID